MSLKISESNGTFYANGSINSLTLQFFINYLDYNLNQFEKVVLNIDNVTEIDKTGLESMRNFTNIAEQNEKIFLIEGIGCKEIYDDFNQKNVA